MGNSYFPKQSTILVTSCRGPGSNRFWCRRSSCNTPPRRWHRLAGRGYRGGASGGAPCVSGVMLHDKEGLRLSEESHGPRTPRNRMAWHWTPFPWPQPTGLTVGAQGRRGAHGSQGGDTEIPQEGLRPRPRTPRLAETSPSLLGLPVSHGLGPGSPAPDAARMSPALPPSSEGRTLRMKSWERSSVCPERSRT